MLHCVSLTLFRGIGVSGDGSPVYRFMGTLFISHGRYFCVLDITTAIG